LTATARRRWPWLAAATLLGLSLAVLAVVAIQRDGDAAVRLAPDDRAVVASGERLYVEHCASCHGRNLEGQRNWRRRLANGRLPAPPHDASGHTWHHPDAVLFELTKHGPAAFAGPDYESDMPAYAGVLGDAEIVAVLSYIKSRWPADIRQAHDRMNARAR